MSQNQLSPDDPRLTAYALGELDPTEQELLEQLLFDSPEAQAAVREIRELAGLLATELRQEPVSGLTAAQRAVIIDAGILDAGRVVAEGAHEPVNHVANRSNEVPALLGLPDAPVPLSARAAIHRTSYLATNRSVIRFASLATIAALVVVVAMMLPPTPRHADLPILADNWERFGESRSLGLQSDFALQEGEGLVSQRGVDSDGLVRFRESSDSLFTTEPAVADSTKPAVADGRTSGARKAPVAAGFEPVQKLAKQEHQAGARGFGYSQPAGSGGGRAGAPGGGQVASEGKPKMPQSADQKFGGQTRNYHFYTPEKESLPAVQVTESQPTGMSGVDRYGAVDRLAAGGRRALARTKGVPQTGPAKAPVLMGRAGTADQKSSVASSATGKNLQQWNMTNGKLYQRSDSLDESIDSGRKGDVAELAQRKSGVEDTIKLHEQAGIHVDPQFAQKVETYNKLLKEQRFDDALVVGREAKALQPENPVSELMMLKARFAKQDAVSDGERADAYSKQLNDVDTAATGYVENLEYPNLERWQDLTEARMKFKRRLTPGTEAYEPIVENLFFSAYEDPLSTFGVDVDTASYSNVRRFLTDQQLPPPNAVRIEELVNYFSYDYPQPAAGQPFSVNVEAANCPWNPGHQLVRIALKGREISRDQRPASNLVFLVDVSGSMQAENKLPLVKMGLNLLTQQMTESDQVAIVTYSDTAVQRLESTNGTNKQQIAQVIDSLQAAGSTNGAAGIQLAYRAALDHFVDGGTNRVILCTDGDFNLGVTDNNALVQLIQERARTKVFFSVFGFGMGNLKDGKLETIADKGNGHYAYIDGQREAQKMFVDELVGTLVTIAKDVKLQVEFNPNQVGAYRLIGYENRVMASQDFNNDKKDAGEIGAGHTVTALYEIVPAGESPKPELGDSLRYRKAVVPQEGVVARELLTVKLRYKLPEADNSTLLEFPAANPVNIAVAAETRGGENFYSVKLQRFDATPAANSLRALFGNVKDPLAIEADDANRLLTFRGSPEQISQARQALVQLGETGSAASREFNWAAAVAAYGMILRNSRFRGQANFDMVLELAQGAKGEDKSGQRAEFIELVKMAKALCMPESVQPPAPEPPAALTREQAEAKASVNGKYRNLLRIVPAAGDAAAYRSFHEFGLWQGKSYLGHDNLPPGYWVYVAPNWYIWGDAK